MEQKKHYKGLTDAEVIESRKKHGANILTPPEKEPLWKQFLEKFTDPLIIILLIAGTASIGISCYEYWGLNAGGEVFFEPGGIFVAILLATGLAFHFEREADKEFAILNQVNDDENVEVIRNENVTKVPRKEIVVGDIVILNTGEEIPADGELLETVMLSVDESTLTGESICRKSVEEKDFDKEATYPTNHVMKGTKVMEGHGICRILAVGDKTEQGKVFEAAQIDDSVKTPLNEQLDGLSEWITKLSYGFAALIVIGRVVMYIIRPEFDIANWAPFVAYLLQTIMIAVTLIVVAVPEGLPMAVTLSLAYSMRRMLRTNNLVRKMHACETMGAATIICTDKTGTLTLNQMKVDDVKLYAKAISKEIIHEGMAVNSTAAIDTKDNKVLGNPTEGALLLWLKEQGVNYMAYRESAKVIKEIPFSTERKYMATLVESTVLQGKKILYVKGAPEIILSLCEVPDNINKVEIDAHLLEYQNRAMRTLGFACRVLDDSENVIEDCRIVANNLQFIGIVAIADPVRPEVPAAVKECVDAGINVKIVTGDTPATAREIGRQIGLWEKTDSERNIIIGPEFEKLSEKELLERVSDLKIIARARPMDKKRLVEALQKNNHVVAVTGDGTNDAPALNVAHVGLSMGDGTSVAKEASDITIIDNSFNSIGKAVMWGRSLYQNIQRFLLFQLTVNVTACFLVLCGAFMGTESPLTVTQMLWINLIMDTFAAMALASLPPSEKVMKDKPRDRNAFILNKNMIYNIVGVGGFFFLLLIVFMLIFKHSEVACLTDLTSLPYSDMFGNIFTLGFWTGGHIDTYELTLLFTIFVITHFFYLFNARAYETGRSALHFKGCKGLIMIVVIILIGQIAMVEIPGLQEFFNVTGLKLIDWIIIIIGSSFVLWIREIWNLFTKK